MYHNHRHCKMKGRRNKRASAVYKKSLPYGEYPKNWSKEMKLAQAMRHYNLMYDSVELVEETVSEDTFRNRYESAVREAKIVMNLCGKTRIGIRAERILRYLTKEREQIINDFLTRCQGYVEA